MGRNVKKKSISTVFRGLATRIDIAATKLCWALPVKSNRIVFQSSIDYWDNPRVFCDYLVEKGLDKLYDIVWIVEDPKKYHSAGRVRFVKRNALAPSLIRDYMVATAKAVIFSHGCPAPHLKRRPHPKQTFILTTHSASQLKRLINRTVRKHYDFILCCGQHALKPRMETWEMGAERFPMVGMPRLDLMFTHRDCIKVMYPQHAGKKLILAMETFKMSDRYVDAPESDDRYALNVITSEEELRELDAFVAKQNAILVIKTHRLQDMSYIEKMNLQNILFLNDDELQEKGVQLNEFLENASLLLTDYSSVFYDYLLVNRPIGFMVGDIEEYTRGFIFDDPFSEMPGQKIQNLEELTTFIADSFEGKDSFEEERMAIKARVFAHPDAKNCERLLNWLTEQHILPSATSTSN